MSDLTFDQWLRLFAFLIGVGLLIGGLLNMSANPEINSEDIEGTLKSFFYWFLGVGGGTAQALAGIVLIVLSIYPKALNVIFKGFK